ncbi:potassium channel family protein [Euzebya tangerina]|uniref:potassium channel family protein n=1 Tax=Euzebya tangerina TaxID=591198 RepID=UPI000E312FA1|nr:potassium channel protein [Euzebya tangerina]
MSSFSDPGPDRVHVGRLPVTRRLAFAGTFFVFVVIGGIVGYVTTQDASLAEASYFTIITIFAVGFDETITLDATGRVLTSGVILLGVGSFTFLTITLIEFFVEGHLLDLVGRRRMERELAELDAHMIICGFGRVGLQVSEDLRQAGRQHIVIDTDENRLESVVGTGVAHIVGDATDERVLERAQIARATGLAVCTDDDAENVLIALTAKIMRPELFIVVRIKNTRNVTKAQQAGADRVIAPTEIGGRRIAALLTKPEVVDFLDIVTHSSDIDLVLEEVTLSERSPLVGRTLANAGLRDKYGANVVAIRRAGKDRPTTRPDPMVALQAGDVLVVIGAQEELSRIQRQLG